MNEELIKSFVEYYNKYIITKREKLDLENLMPLIEQKEELLNTYQCNFLLEAIIENYSFSESSCLSSLILHSNIYQNSENENWLSFGRYGGFGLEYCIDIYSGNIFCVDQETNKIQWRCATTEEGFLKSVIEILRLETEYLMNPETRTDELLKSTLFKCIFLSELNTDEPFYKYVLGYGLD